jgi:hypothetical protein
MSTLDNRVQRLEAAFAPDIPRAADLWRALAARPQPSVAEEAHRLYEDAQASVFADIDGTIAAAARGQEPIMLALARFGLDADRATLQAAGILDAHGTLVAGITEEHIRHTLQQGRTEG